MTSKYRFDSNGSLVDPDSYFLLRQNYPGLGLGPPVQNFLPGQLWMRGSNATGQLGQGTVGGSSATFVKVGASTAWTKVWVSGPHGAGSTNISVFGLNGGQLYAWGSNANDCLGLGTNDNEVPTPTLVGYSNVRKVASGTNSSWLITSGGSIRCCGLVNGSDTFLSLPVSQPGPAVDIAITAYPHGVFAILEDGTLWGYNTGFNVHGSNEDIPAGSSTGFVQIGNETDWVSIDYNLATFQRAIVAMKSNGSRWVLGEVDASGNDYGASELTVDDVVWPYPITINKLAISSTMEKTDAGSSSQTTAISAAGDLIINAGSNSSVDWAAVAGDLGIDIGGSLRSTQFPYTSQSEDVGWAVVSQGGNNFAAIAGNVVQPPQPANPLTSASRLLWRMKTHFEPYTYDDKQLLWAYDNVRQWKQIASDNKTFLAVTNDGHLYAWGLNSRYPLGLAQDSEWPRRVGSDTNWSKAIVGLGLGGGPQATAHYGALKSDNTLWVWGSNYNGQLGLGSVGGEVWTPTQVPGVWYDVKFGYNFSVAVGSDAGTPRIFTWGADQSGAHGTGTDIVFGVNSPQPLVIPGLTLNTTSTVALGYAGADERHFVLTKDANTNVLWAWGSNSHGQLGLGSSGNVINVPTQVAFSALSFVAGYQRSAAMSTDVGNFIYVAGNMTGFQMCTSRFHGTTNPLTTFSQTGDDFTTPGIAEFDLYTISEDRIIMAKSGGANGVFKFEGTGRTQFPSSVRSFQSLFQVTPGSELASGVQDDDLLAFLIETINPVA